MSRKIFLFFLATLVLAAVQMADAQQPKKVPRIGLFHVGLVLCNIDFSSTI